MPNWPKLVGGQLSKKKAVLGYLHTRFSYNLREETKKNNQIRSLILVQLESNSLFRHPHLGGLECSTSSLPVRVPIVLGPGKVDIAERLSNFILGMGGFWLEARQWPDLVWWRHVKCFNNILCIIIQI